MSSISFHIHHIANFPLSSSLPKFHLNLSIHSILQQQKCSLYPVKKASENNASSGYADSKSTNKLNFNHAKVLFKNVDVQKSYKLKVTLLDEMHEIWTSCKLDLRKILREGSGRKFLRMNVPMSPVQGNKPVISMTYLNPTKGTREGVVEATVEPNEQQPATNDHPQQSVEGSHKQQDAAADEDETSTTNTDTETEEVVERSGSSMQPDPRATDKSQLLRDDSLQHMLDYDYSKDLNVSNILDEFERLNTLTSDADEVKNESSTRPHTEATQQQQKPESTAKSPQKPSPKPASQSEVSTILSEESEELDLMEQNTCNEIIIQDLKQEMNEMRTKMRMLQSKSEYTDLFQLYEEDIAKLHEENQSLLKENQDVSLKYQRDLLKKHSSNESLSFYVHSHYKSLKQENQQLKLKLFKLMQISAPGDKTQTLHGGSSALNRSMQSQSGGDGSPSSRSSIYREGNAVLRRKLQQLTDQLDETKVELQRERMQNTKLSMKLRRYAQGMSTAAGNLRPYKENITRLKEEVTQLNETLTKTQAENDTLREELLQTRHNLLESSDQFETLQEHMAKMLQKTQALESERRMQRNQLSSLEGQLNESMSKYDELHESKKPDALIEHSQQRPVVLPGERRELNAAFAKLALLLEDNNQALFALEHLRDVCENLEHEILDVRANELSYIELLMEYRYRLQTMQSHDAREGENKRGKSTKKKRTSRSKSVPRSG